MDGTQLNPQDPEGVPSHRCLILGQSFEALKSARSSTEAMRKVNQEMDRAVNTEGEKNEQYKQSASDYTRFSEEIDNTGHGMNSLINIRTKSHTSETISKESEDAERSDETVSKESKNAEQTDQTVSKKSENAPKTGQTVSKDSEDAKQTNQTVSNDNKNAEQTSQTVSKDRKNAEQIGKRVKMPKKQKTAKIVDR